MPELEIDDLRLHLRRTDLVIDQVLHEVGNPLDLVYFLEDGIVSVCADTHDRGKVEVSLIGCDGLVGGQLLLDGNCVTEHRSVVQIPGSSHALERMEFRSAVQHLPAFRDRCAQYILFLLAQASQLAACNARHELPARLAFLILMCIDRIDDKSVALQLDQESLANMLGVRRAGVSVAIDAMRTAGLITTSRGRLSVIDRAGLERTSCTCYRFVADRQERKRSTPPN